MKAAKRKTTSKRKKLPRVVPYDLLHKKAWEMQSRRVRKEANGICFTCGHREWDEELGENSIKGMQAGHYIHGKLDFDPMNIHCQCVRCNKWLSGNLGIYGEKLIALYGLEAIEDMRRRSHTTVYSRDFLIEKIKEELTHMQ